MSIESNISTPPAAALPEETKAPSKKKRPLEQEEREEKKARVETALKPSEDEWTKKALHINWFQEQIYHGVIFHALATFIQPKIKKESWEIIKNTKIGECKTVGHVEKVAIQILDREMTTDQKKKEAVHEQLKKSLQTLADHGIWPAIPMLTELMKMK